MSRATNPFANWTALMFDACWLWADAGAVVTLRSARLMSGDPDGARELERMFGEKIQAGFELAGALAGGEIRSPETAVRNALRIYGKRVRGNRRRLETAA